MPGKILTVPEHTVIPEEILGPQVVAELEGMAARLPPKAYQVLRHGVKTGSHVGVIQVEGTTIQIVPKVFPNNEKSLALLLFMLQYTERTQVYGGDPAAVANLTGAPLLEIWIRSFACRCRDLLRHRMRRQYREVEERSSFLRGKLLTERMHSGREQLTGRYPCRYQTFTSDHLLNQLIRFCSRLLLRLSRSPDTQGALNEIDALLVDVELRSVTLAEAESIRLNRLNRMYEPILEFCRVVLRNASIDLRAGRIRQLAILIDMNKVYEDLIGTLLYRHRSEICLADGVTLEDLDREPSIGQLFGEFTMQPDVVLKGTDGSRVLLDAKYKRLKRNAGHQGLEIGDFYQMYGYSSGGDRDYDRIVLVYPSTGALSRDYITGDLRLSVRQLDLKSLLRLEGDKVSVDLAELNKLFT